MLPFPTEKFDSVIKELQDKNIDFVVEMTPNLVFGTNPRLYIGETIISIIFVADRWEAWNLRGTEDPIQFNNNEGLIDYLVNIARRKGTSVENSPNKKEE